RPAFANPDTSETADEDSYYYRAEVFLRRGGLAYDDYGYEDKELISDILDHFEKYLDFLQLSPGVLPWNMAEHDELLNTPKESGAERAWAIPAGLRARRSFRSLLQQADDFRITEDARQGVAHDFTDQTGIGGLVGGIAEAMLSGGAVATVVALIERTHFGAEGRADVCLGHIDPFLGRNVAELRQADHQAVGVGCAIGHHAEAQLTQCPFYLLADMVQRLRVDGQVAGIR